MATYLDPRTILLDLDAHNANRLLLEPALNYENVLQSILPIYRIEMGKDKVTMNHLSKPQNVLQPKSNCNTWNPTVTFSLRADEIVVSDYEVNGEQCTDEFMKRCARNLLGSQEDSLYMDRARSLGLQDIQTAMIQTLSQSIVDSYYKSIWFSDTTFGTSSYAYADYVDEAKLINNGMTSVSYENLRSMLTVQNGVWSEIIANVTAGNIKYVDTNDGNSGGNMTKSANIVSFLRTMKNTSDPLLRFWGYGPGSTTLDRPYFLLQYGLFKAYKEYLQSTGTEESQRLIVNGIPVDGVYMFDGHPVMAIPEWTMYDNEVGLMHPTTGLSRVQRAIFTVPENITILANMKSLEGMGSSGLIFQQSTDIKDKGVKWLYYALGMGMRIAHDKLMTVGYNSELDTFG